MKKAASKNIHLHFEPQKHEGNKCEPIRISLTGLRLPEHRCKRVVVCASVFYPSRDQVKNNHSQVHLDA